LTTYNATPKENHLAKLLGIPLLSSKCDSSWYGTKAGSRQLFAICGVPLPPGTGDCRSIEVLVSAIADLWKENQSTFKYVVKLNEGFGGEGNALLDLTPIHEARLKDNEPWTDGKIEIKNIH